MMHTNDNHRRPTPILVALGLVGLVSLLAPHAPAGELAEPMVKKMWQERPSTEEVTRGIEAALEIPAWHNPSPEKGATRWTQVALGITDSDNANHDKAGRVRCAAWAYDQDLGETTLYIGASSGGLYKLGRNPFLPVLRMWVPLSWNLPGSPSVGAFLVHPLDSHKILIGTGDHGRGYDVGSGLYRTTDAGASWSKAPMSPQPEYFDTILSDRNDASGNTVVAASQTGLWRSTNFGASWSRVANGHATMGVTDVAQHPSGSPWFLAVPGTGVLRCPALGSLCFIASGFAAPVYRTSIAVAASDPDWVFALVAGGKRCSGGDHAVCSSDADCPGTTNTCSWHDSGLLNGIYRSADGGSSFARIEQPGTDEISGGQGFHAQTIAVSPSNPDLLLVGMAGVQMSLNATATDPTDVCWKRNVGYNDAGWCSLSGVIDIGHGDQTSATFVPTSMTQGYNRIIVTNDGGISDYNWYLNTMDDWLNELGPNLSQTYPAAIARGVNDPDRLLVGTQDNGTIKVDLDQADAYTYVPTLSGSTGADGGPVSINPGNPDHFGTSVGLPYRRYLSTNGGASWSNVDAGLNERFLPAVRFHRQPAMGMFFSYDDDRYIRFRFPWDDPLDPWSYANPYHPLPASVLISDVEVARSVNTVIYVTDSLAAENGTAALYVMEEGDTGGDLGDMNWEDRTPNNIGSSPVNEGIVIPDRSSQLADHVYFVTGSNRPSRAFLSPDFGKHWFEVTGNLKTISGEVSFWHMVAHPFDHGQLFLAAETGVYRSDDGGQQWYRYMDGMPTVVKARGLEIHATTKDDAHLVVATWGHGLWERDVEYVDLIFRDGFENGTTSRW